MAVERFDLVRVLARRLGQLQDGASGGMVLMDPDAGEEAAEVCFSGGVGMALVADGLDLHIPKGYLYFAMGFSFFVEILNMKFRSKKPVAEDPDVSSGEDSFARGG